MELNSPPHILILAAGLSSRMRGTDKLLIQIDGVPQLRRLAEAALATKSPTHVVLGPTQEDRRRALADLPVNLSEVPPPARSMAESLKAGLAAVPQQAAVMLLLADLPDLGAAEIAAMVAAHATAPAAILRGGTISGRPGHPVVLPAWLRPELCGLEGDIGAREVLARYADRIQLVPLPDQVAITDLDTPEDWAAWWARRRAKFDGQVTDDPNPPSERHCGT